MQAGNSFCYPLSGTFRIRNSFIARDRSLCGRRTSSLLRCRCDRPASLAKETGAHLVNARIVDQARHPTGRIRDRRAESGANSSLSLATIDVVPKEGQFFFAVVP